MRLSIRWRLTIWITLALTVVLTCFATVVYGMLRRALYEQTDRLLAAGFGLLQKDTLVETATAERLRYWIEEYKEHQNLLCVVYRSDGTLQAWTEGLAKGSLPHLPAGPANHWIYDQQLPTLGRLRIMAEERRFGGKEFVVMLLAPLEAVDHELEQMRHIFLTAGSAALLLSAGLAYVLARKAMGPVDKLRRSTDAITADRLDQRLPVANPHDELGLLAQTINSMIRRLESSFAEIRRFTADASHELRTPLTVLRAEVEVALNKSLTVDECHHHLGNLLDELVRMSRLTDQLLTLSRRDAGVEQLETASLDLHLLVADVMDAMQPLAQTKGVSLQIEGRRGLVQVTGDGGRLRQVFINLLDNAIKYTPEGGRVTVFVGCRDTSAQVIVRDTGIGISAEHLPHVFERFYRVDKARSRAEGGTGLGLSIVQSIIRAHGGSIEMASQVGKGTVCTVNL